MYDFRCILGRIYARSGLLSLNATPILADFGEKGNGVKENVRKASNECLKRKYPGWGGVLRSCLWTWGKKSCIPFTEYLYQIKAAC